jgi:hypothetical protein
MPAIAGRASGHGAGVRKPPKHEPAGLRRRSMGISSFARLRSLRNRLGGDVIEFHEAGRLAFFGTQAGLADRRLFLRHLAPVRKKRWVAYAKPPFAGPEAVLAYLSRYTHRIAISNQRLMAFDETGVTLPL